MTGRLSGHARRVLELAHRGADGLGHGGLGPEHVVPGALRDGTSRAAQALGTLGTLGIDLAQLRGVRR